MNFDNLWNSILSGLAFVIFSMILLGINKIKKYIRGRKNSIGKVLEKAVILNRELVELRVKYDACRAVIFMFKNGDYYTSGDSELRLCPVYESCANYAVSLIDIMHPINVSSFPEMFQEIVRLKKSKYYVTENLKDKKLKSIIESKNHYSWIVSPIFNARKRPIGYLEIQYFSKPKGQINTEVFDEYCLKLEYIINNM